MKSKRNMLPGGLAHVHGEIFINDAALTPGKQPHAHHAQGDMQDHSFLRYAEVSSATAHRAVYVFLLKTPPFPQSPAFSSSPSHAAPLSPPASPPASFSPGLHHKRHM